LKENLKEVVIPMSIIEFSSPMEKEIVVESLKNSIWVAKT